ncbi:NADH dehydrogenase [ubiquinone] 1 alpha subcomplex subunit 5-like [Dysidea avara]|uniref:NADH dehydrogenase [ubiquinone] 1 alpha subcomplex subunit 5-like n=1 Tax=Dysidea avara TaxID=196820 RepID=UPI0033312F8C
MAGSIKKSTSITGLAVIPQAREILCSLYAKTISALSRLPEEATYRKNTERIVQQRLNIVQEEVNVEKIEQKIGCGQVEQLIDQAERELSLATKMEMWKPWEPLLGEPPDNQWKWP